MKILQYNNFGDAQNANRFIGKGDNSKMLNRNTENLKTKSLDL
jgi:hypothetical protein